MDREQRRVLRFTEGAREMSAEERQAMRAALNGAMTLASRADQRRMLKLVENIGAARGRAVQRRASDRRCRGSRRLVGARVPTVDAERCKACAALLGVSEYRFVVEALNRECARVELETAGRAGLPGGGEAGGCGGP